MAVSTSRTVGLTQTTDLGQAGATFNDATRLLTGGLWSTPNDNNGQQASLGTFTADIHAVLNDVAADLALGAGGQITVGGNAYTLTATDITALTDVQSQLNTMLTNAPTAAAFGHGATAAQQALHAADVAVLNDINGDTGLATALANASYAGTTGATDHGFQAPVAGSDSAAAIAAATAQGATLADIGNVFNAATALSVGGLNHSNMAEFTADMKAVATGVQNILNSPSQLAAIEAGETANAAALTTIHLQTVENQINLQLNKFDGEFANNPNVAARATTDNLLDVIDIVQGDANLNMNAGGNGTPAATGGFAEEAGFLSGTITHFQDNQAQTNFWAQFLSEANVINNQLTAVAGGATTVTNGTSTLDIAHLITEIQNYQKFGASFDHSQGGIFGARFDNELLGGTLNADTSAAIKGLTGIMNGDTGAALAADKAMITAAGQGFAADAMDVSGNNNPFGGGHYVGTATTVAGATSIAGLAQGTTMVGPVANGQTGLSSAAPMGHGGGGFGGVAGGPEPGGVPTPVDHHWHWG
jgi:trimeric autotransporter adhesin